jgi:lysophospholipase L1-like esterase
MSVINGGLTASRVLNDSPCFGVNAGARLDREVLARRGIRAVIYTQGTNDFGYPVIAAEDLGLPPECFEPAAEVSAEQVIEGYRQVIARVHAAGVRIFGGTLNPIKGSFEWSEETEVKRQALNDWIRTSGEFDGVIDFASAVADPADPEALAPEFDCGDHLHPNDDGYAAMANAVNLDLFR